MNGRAPTGQRDKAHSSRYSVIPAPSHQFCCGSFPVAAPHPSLQSLLAENVCSGKSSDQNTFNCRFAANKDVTDVRSTRAGYDRKVSLAACESKKLARESVDVSSQLIDLIVNRYAALGQVI